MADIELVIKIPEEIYNRFGYEYSEENLISKYTNDAILEAFCNGTPLPKGHGDLIDRNDLLKHYDNTTYHNGIEERKIHFVQIGYVNDAPIIIEADTAEK